MRVCRYCGEEIPSNRAAQARYCSKKCKVKATGINYRKNHPDKVAEVRRKYRESHREQLRAYQSQYQKEHREELNEKRRARYASDPEFRNKSLASSRAKDERRKDEIDRYSKLAFTEPIPGTRRKRS